MVGASLFALAGASYGDNTQLGADVRSFGNNEKLTYLSVSASQALCGCGDLWLQLDGTFSKRTTLPGNGFTIAHGGSDVELLASYFPKQYPIGLSLGVALPNTSSRSAETDITYRAAYYIVKRDGAQVSIDSYGVATVSPLFIVGMSGSYQLGATRFRASLGAPVRGNNSVSILSGQPNRVGLFSVGAEWKIGAIKGDCFSLAVTNQLGWTTGMAATPALGGNPGLSLAYTVKF